MSSNDSAIRVRNLSKCYQIYDVSSDRLKQFIWPRLQQLAGRSPKQYFREFWSLREIAFEVKKGETVGIIGRNGSGKSTLLQIICGTLHPTHGQVEVTGRVAALLELGSGFNLEFTGRDNVFLNAAVMGLTRAQTSERFAKIEAFADIGQFIDQPVKTYSSGMLVRLAFAVIAHVDADILVIDEALAVGDAFFTQKCMRFLRDFMQRGTVLFVSHDTALVKSLCSRAIWLDKGEIVRDDSPNNVCEDYLQAYYEGQQDVGVVVTTKISRAQPELQPPKDQRMEFINNSNLRNDVQLFQFNAHASGFGAGCAVIDHVEFLDVHGAPLGWIVGGEAVCLRITATCRRQLNSPIVGFFVKDRTGQALFGDNTFITYMKHPKEYAAGTVFEARFSFTMPRLAHGDYVVTVSVATGTQEQHEQQHWIHDALHFKSESTSVAAGLIGVPMSDISIETTAHPDNDQ